MIRERSWLPPLLEMKSVRRGGNRQLLNGFLRHQSDRLSPNLAATSAATAASRWLRAATNRFAATAIAAASSPVKEQRQDWTVADGNAQPGLLLFSRRIFAANEDG